MASTPLAVVDQDCAQVLRPREQVGWVMDRGTDDLAVELREEDRAPRGGSSC